MIVLVPIIHLYHQKNLRQGLNTFWVLKPPNFGNIFQPACLLHPARLLDRLEYLEIDVTFHTKRKSKVD